ncbi:unnamed protein product [Prorocentrum cordatum]|uniref:Ion transport domain-containing protein n=1 Tax=Prorocentrum cordatum TaxID=2364126 RepID=A0ABN9WA64_9DINO|nr:unnamed protein product [Polarella glacialis]
MQMPRAPLETIPRMDLRMDVVDVVETVESSVMDLPRPLTMVKPPPPDQSMGLGTWDAPEPVVVDPEPFSFKELMGMLADAHHRQVRGLEAEAARARERLAKSERRQTVLERELEEAARRSSVPGAVEPVCGRSQSRSRTLPARFPQGQHGGLAEGVPQGRALTKDTTSTGNGRSAWANELAKISRMDSVVRRFTVEESKFNEHRTGRWAYKIVKSVYFDALSYVLIIANSIFIGVFMEHQLSCAIKGRTSNKAFDIVEAAFVVWFSVELLLKILAEDVKVFLGPDWPWNALDLVLVISAVGQLASESGAPNISFARNLRLVRVVSILRVARVVRICQSLRVMIFAILRCLDALLWVFIVLAFFMYIFAMSFMHAVTVQFQDFESTWLAPCPDQESCQSDELGCPAKCAHLTWLDYHLGSLPKIMLMLFQSMTNGRDWAEVYDMLHQIHGNYGFIFVVFIYFMFFLVLNVSMVGTVVDVTSGVSKRDRDPGSGQERDDTAKGVHEQHQGVLHER